MRRITLTSRFRRDVRLAGKRGKDLNRLHAVLDMLQRGETLPERYRDHALGGAWQDVRDCHIEPDWLLLYMIRDDELVLVRTGSHADLF